MKTDQENGLVKWPDNRVGRWGSLGQREGADK